VLKTRFLFLTSLAFTAAYSTLSWGTDWTPKVVQVGDHEANYLNVEITADNKYMIWFEGAVGQSTSGVVWHCMIDQETGDLIPSDCRGFRGFESTSWGRPNPGYDAKGAYYVGADAEGRFVMVRPDGATSGKVTVLSTPPDLRRRAVYPSILKSRESGYVLFIQNESTPGAGVRPRNNWVELQYVDLAQPERVHVIERQETPPRGFAPMDAGFVRWMRGRPIITYGHASPQTGKVEIRAFDVENPEKGSFFLIEDGSNKIDPFPKVMEGYEYILAGIDGTASSNIYRRPAESGNAPFQLYRRLYPDETRLNNPSLAQSHEPFIFKGKLYTVYQVNEKGQRFFDTTFRQPGEIWLADLTSEPLHQWLIAPETRDLIAEPEPVVTETCVWIFYNRPIIEASESQQPSTMIEDETEPRRGRGLIREWLKKRRASRGGGMKMGLPRLALYRASVPMCDK
jgi:hypothetical protein